MAYTQAQIRTDLLAELRDNGTVWPAVQLDRAIEAAVAMISGWFPQSEVQDLPYLIGDQSFQLVSNTAAGGARLLRVMAVELPISTYLPMEPWEQALQYGRRATRSDVQAWRYRLPELWLRKAVTTNGTGRVWLWRSFTFPTIAGNAFNGDEIDYSLLLKLAARECWTYFASEQARENPRVQTTYLFDKLLVIMDQEIETMRQARQGRLP